MEIEIDRLIDIDKDIHADIDMDIYIYKLDFAVAFRQQSFRRERTIARGPIDT